MKVKINIKFGSEFQKELLGGFMETFLHVSKEQFSKKHKNNSFNYVILEEGNDIFKLAPKKKVGSKITLKKK